MPVITISRRYLNRLLGRDMENDELVDSVAKLGAEVEEFEGNDALVEMPPNRSDMYSVEGFARALKGVLGVEKGLRPYPLSASDIVLDVDESVQDVRPYVVGGIAKNLELDEDCIKSLMDLQEKIHLTLGRNRRKVSIGIHDFDRISPPFKYLAVEPKSRRFVPLAKDEEMDMEEILRRHEKGVDFAFILEGFDRYPLIVDSKDNVLSFPPIINSSLTTVTEDTKNIFIDVTGTDLNLIQNALNIVATGMAETGASLYSIKVNYHDRQIATPDLTPRMKNLNSEYANRLLGLSLESNSIKDAFERMRFGVELKGNDILVGIPAYRSDILHPIDLVEDLAIGYGYENFELTVPKILTFGSKRRLTVTCQKFRELMLGLGFQEVDTLALGKEAESQATRLKNPLSEEQSTLRTSLVPSLLDTLRINKRHELPQKIFEVGHVVVGSKVSINLGAAVIHSKASFTEIKSYVEAIIQPLNMKVGGTKHRYFINGRCAFVLSDEDEVGIFGEIHPRIITQYELGYPIVAFELSIIKLEQKIQ